MKFFKVEHRYDQYDHWRPRLTTTDHERATRCVQHALETLGGEVCLVECRTNDQGDFYLADESYFKAETTKEKSE